MNITYLVLGIQIWTIIEVILMKQTNRLRFGRIESDAESEKDTRKRFNETIEKRLRHLEAIK